jgi:hypothetical protein
LFAYLRDCGFYFSFYFVHWICGHMSIPSPSALNLFFSTWPFN